MRGKRLRPRRRLGKRQFERVFREGRCAKGIILNLWARKETLQHETSIGPKLGIIVSRRTSKLAVKRNLWRRRIREAFRSLQLRIPADYTIVVQSRGLDHVPSYQSIKKEMERLLEKVKILP